ncbi:hypothetical protein HPP92_002546 [Vanilla planifolia]|uniref:Uncharacterized protein n=1 Tax=Vanilla planifolia TaxID=51239 RepID=A0A835RSS3_VANPL|nr:hypothetical protein HPP92_002546 [Vanilla planifolia]
MMNTESKPTQKSTQKSTTKTQGYLTNKQLKPFVPGSLIYLPLELKLDECSGGTDLPQLSLLLQDRELSLSLSLSTKDGYHLVLASHQSHHVRQTSAFVPAKKQMKGLE